MYNDQPCDACDYFDPVLRGKQGKLTETSWGWCAKKSVYPYKEGPGQKFPVGVMRVASADELAKPVIVQVNQVMSHCKDYKSRKTKQSKASLLQLLKNT